MRAFLNAIKNTFMLRSAPFDAALRRLRRKGARLEAPAKASETQH
jgi:hypothetical protein